MKRIPMGAVWKWALRLAAVLAVLGALAPMIARSGPVSRLVAARVVRAIEAGTGRAVGLEAAVVEIFPVSIRIQGLVIAGSDGSLDDPFLSLRDASGMLSLRALLGGEILVDAVEVDGIELHWQAGKRPHAPKPAGEKKGSRRQIKLRRLNVRNGAFTYQGRRGRFHLDADGLEATAASIPCDATLCVGGSARAGRFDLAYGDHHLDGDELSVRFAYDGDRLEVSRFHVTGAGLDASGDATWRTGENSTGRVTATLEARPPGLGLLAAQIPRHRSRPGRQR